MRRALALLGPVARRAATPAPLLRPPQALGAWFGFSADAAPSAAPSDRTLWYTDKTLSVQQLHDEIFRRWDKAPTPGKAALDVLLTRACTPEEVKLAAAAIERFHKQRCAAGWLTGLGARTSGLFAAACSRAGAPEVAMAAFSRANALGLALSPDTTRRLIALASQKGADETLKAYRALRGGGMRVTPEVARMVMRGMQGPGRGGSPRRALDAASAFVADGIAPGRRAWNALLCAASAVPDLAVLSEAHTAMTAAGETPNAITHLALAQGALVAGDAAAAAEQLRSCVAAAPALMGGTRPGDVPPMEALARVAAAWAAALPAGAATPGGAAGLAGRLREALAASGGKLPLDVDALLGSKELVDGPCAPPPAAQ